MDTNLSRIEELLLNNPLDRNKNLNAMLSFLNNIENQLILNLDDNWGTGKTIFLKQLEFLNTSKHESIKNIDLDKIKAYQENYEVFYFNAWEHDLYNNPLESLVYSLLLKIQELDEKILVKNEILEFVSKKLKQLGVLVGNTVLKSITAGQIDLKTLQASQDDPSPLVTSIEVKREAINSIIQFILNSSDKKLLIIVDELDRCKPTYALEFLEVIKHFFVNDDVVFLFGTNKKELAETIKGEYGNNFDGYKYLNKFFDFEFSLPDFKKVDYLSFIGQNNYRGSYYYMLEMVLICNYFNFTLRDINRYMSICDKFKGYWDKSSHYVAPYQKVIFLPFVIGLKIQDGTDYRKFVSGKGKGILEEFYNFDTKLHNEIIFRTLEKKRIKYDTNDEYMELSKKELFSFYDQLNNSSTNNRHDDGTYAMEEILEVLSMMSIHTM